jgi:hypothetical protein
VGDFVCVMAVLAAGYSTSYRRNSSEVEHGADSAEVQARRTSAEDPGRQGSEIGGVEGTVGRLTDETDYVRLADHPEGGQATDVYEDHSHLILVLTQPCCGNARLSR